MLATYVYELLPLRRHAGRARGMRQAAIAAYYVALPLRCDRLYELIHAHASRRLSRSPHDAVRCTPLKSQSQLMLTLMLMLMLVLRWCANLNAIRDGHVRA